MLAGPPSKKRKLNEIANNENMEEEKENPENLKRKIMNLKINMGKHLRGFMLLRSTSDNSSPSFSSKYEKM